MDIQTLREQRSHVAAQARQLLDDIEPNSWNDDHNQQYDVMVAEIGRIDDQLERLEEQLKIEAADHAITQQRAERDGVSDDEADNNINMEKSILNAYIRGGVESLDADQRHYVEQRRMRADLSTGTDSAGGYLVPTDFATRLIEEMKLFGNMRLVATIQQTDSGVPIEWPVADNLDQEGEIVAENVSVTDEDPTFGIKTIGAYK